MDEKLKPCPCCGEIPTIFKTYRSKGKMFCGYFVSCDNFDCSEFPSSDRFMNKSDAIADWNTRIGGDSCD